MSCVLRDGCYYKAGLASTRASTPGPQTSKMIGSKKEGALQPRLVPLRVHEGGVHGPVQELLVEQDAVDVLHCGSTQNSCVGPENGD